MYACAGERLDTLGGADDAASQREGKIELCVTHRRDFQS